MNTAQKTNECPHCGWIYWTPEILKLHILAKHPAKDPLIDAAPDMLAALKAVFLNPKINHWLAVNDPQALKQIGKAVAKAMNVPVDWEKEN